MKSKSNRKESLTGPLLKDMIDRQKAASKQVLPPPVVGSQPLNPPDLYQDAGGGYNSDLTFPQE